MKKSFLIIAVGAALSINCQAAPTYKQARGFYDQLKQPFFDTGMFYKKAFKERQAYLSAAKALRDKAETMFGTPSNCFSAATMRFEYARSLHDFASRQEGIVNSPLDWKGVTDPMYAAFMYGEATAACYIDVEALDKK